MHSRELRTSIRRSLEQHMRAMLAETWVLRGTGVPATPCFVEVGDGREDGGQGEAWFLVGP